MITLALLSACAVADRTQLEIPIRSGGTGVATIELGDGATVTLTEATATFTDLRLEEPPAAVADWISTLNPLSAAYAHPGHDYPGEVAGELLGTWTVDLLGEDTELGTAPCYSGEYATGRVSVDGTAAVFAGTLDTASASTPFRFEVAASQNIIGIPFEVTLAPDAQPTEIDLRFDPIAALSYTDWSPPDADGDGTLTVADQPYGNTVLFGVVATPTWSLTLVP